MGDGLRRNLPSAKLARITNDLELTLRRFVGNVSSSSKSSLMSVRKGLRVSKVSKAEAREMRIWIRTAAYISQVINSISKTYDC